MRELRQDPLTGRWVALCDDHVDYRVPTRSFVATEDACPFCPGGAARKASPLDQVGHAMAWPHQTPILRVEEGSEAVGPGRRPGLGAHEVLVGSERHAAAHELSAERGADLMRLAARRLLDLRGDRRLGAQGWGRRVRPGSHGRDTVSAWPSLPGSPEPIGRDAVASAVVLALRDGRELGRVGDVHVWCSLAPQRPFEVRLAWLGSGPADAALSDLALALRGVERLLASEVGPHGHDACWRAGPPTDAPVLLTGCVEVAPVTVVDHPPLVGVLPSHAATPEVVAEPLRDRFRAAVCHDADVVEGER